MFRTTSPWSAIPLARCRQELPRRAEGRARISRGGLPHAIWVEDRIDLLEDPSCPIEIRPASRPLLRVGNYGNIPNIFRIFADCAIGRKPTHARDIQDAHHRPLRLLPLRVDQALG